MLPQVVEKALPSLIPPASRTRLILLHRTNTDTLAPRSFDPHDNKDTREQSWCAEHEDRGMHMGHEQARHASSSAPGRRVKFDQGSEPSGAGQGPATSASLATPSWQLKQRVVEPMGLGPPYPLSCGMAGCSIQAGKMLQAQGCRNRSHDARCVTALSPSTVIARMRQAVLTACVCANISLQYTVYI